MIPHCTACAADAEVAHEGCGDPSCCGPTYCLPCGCARGEVCTLEGDNSDCAGCAACSRAPSTCLVAVMVRERAAAKEMTLSAYVAELVARDEPEQEPSAPVREAFMTRMARVIADHERKR